MSLVKIYSKKLKKTKINNIDFSSFDSNQTNISKDENLKQNIIKTVFFNSVEIIDVESYKKYNQEGILKLETIEKNSILECKDCNCTIF